MFWWKQLRLLLMKNYVSHRRQKLRVFMEILWPLLLMVILMWVRTRGLRTFVHECHFDHKAMPSAGIVEFIKSTICSFNNTCNQQITDGKSTLLSEQRSSTPFEQFETILRTRLTDENLNNFKVIDSDLETLSQLTKLLTNPKSSIQNSVRLKDLLDKPIGDTFAMYNLTNDEIDFLDTLTINWTIIPLMFKYQTFNFFNLLCDEDKGVDVSNQIFTSNNLDHDQMIEQLREKLCDNYNSNSTSSSDSISKSFQVLQLLNNQALLHEISTISKSSIGQDLHVKQLTGIGETINHIVNDVTKMDQFDSLSSDLTNYWYALRDAVDNPGNNTIRLIQLWLCGRNSSQLYENLPGGPGTRLEELGEEMRAHLIHNRPSNTTDYIYDNTTTTECNSLFLSLESGSVTKVLWRQFKPFVRGKIIYSPNRASIKRILSRVLYYFQPIQLFHNLSIIWIDEIGPRLNESLNDESSLINNITRLILSNDIPFATDLITSRLGINSTDGRDNVVSLLGQFKNITQFISTDGPSILQTIDTFLRKLKMYMECIELDKLEAYESEDEMVRRGGEFLS